MNFFPARPFISRVIFVCIILQSYFSTIRLRLMICIAIIASAFVLGLSQSDLSPVTNLAFYADILTNASAPEHRTHAHELFRQELDNLLHGQESFINTMDDVPWIFVKYNKDKSFRLISWQLEKEENEFDYFTIFQSSDGMFTYFNSDVESIEEREKYDLDHSYSAIFHNIYSYEDYFILSAFRQIDGKRSQKICEVLTLKNGKPILGKAIFNQDKNTPEGRGKKRIILQYSPVAKANINVNIDDGIIIYDHVITIPGRNPDEGILQVPDGSYQAYEFDGGGKWIYKEKLYAEIQETPLNKSLKSGEESRNK